MFSPDTTAFLADLARNNSRDWFIENKPRYEAHWKSAANDFCDAMSAGLTRAYGGHVAAKLFRIHRDVRFSKDKTPYNAHVHMSFHAGGRKDMGWMVGLDAEKLTVGFGLFQFKPAQLDAWRHAVDGPDGAALADAVATGQAAGLRLDPPALKRVPAPFDKDHRRGDLLRRKGMAMWRDDLPLDAAFGPEAPARLTVAFAPFQPLRAWLSKHLPP